MSKVKNKVVLDASQTTISHVFGMVKKTSSSEVKKAEEVSKKLTSDDPRVQAFYDSLGPREIVAHMIAIEKLGTSYDVTRTHGFLRWSAAAKPSK
jgi:hypothetical protein